VSRGNLEVDQCGASKLAHFQQEAQWYNVMSEVLLLRLENQLESAEQGIIGNPLSGN